MIRRFRAGVLVANGVAAWTCSGGLAGWRLGYEPADVGRWMRGLVSGAWGPQATILRAGLLRFGLLSLSCNSGPMYLGLWT